MRENEFYSTVEYIFVSCKKGRFLLKDLVMISKVDWSPRVYNSFPNVLLVVFLVKFYPLFNKNKRGALSLGRIFLHLRFWWYWNSADILGNSQDHILSICEPCTSSDIKNFSSVQKIFFQFPLVTTAGVQLIFPSS